MSLVCIYNVEGSKDKEKNIVWESVYKFVCVCVCSFC